MTLLLGGLFQASADENRLELIQGQIEIIVDDQIVIFDIVAHFGGGLLHAAFDDVPVVLPAVVQALAQGGGAGRQDEHGAGIRCQTAYLLGTLPVDLENQVVALGQGLSYPGVRGTVIVAEDFGMFKKLAAADHGLEVVYAGEVVVDAIGFTRTGGAGGMGNGYADKWQVIQQGLDQTGFAGTRRGGNDVKGACALSAHVCSCSPLWQLPWVNAVFYRITVTLKGLRPTVCLCLCPVRLVHEMLLETCMDLNLARTFLTVVYGGSFVLAAERLCVSQTTVTARIKSLEEQLGAQLFVRSASGSSLTPAGERFVPHAQQLLATWQDALRNMSACERKEPLRIGAETGLWQPWLTRWLSWLKLEQPDLHMQARVGQGSMLLDQMENGTLDILLSHQARYRPALHVRLLMEETLVQVRHVENPEPHIQTDWGEAFRQQFELAFPAQHAQIETNVGQLALQLLLEQGGTGYFRSQVVAPWLASGQLMRVAGAPEFSLPVYVMTRKACNHPQLQTALHGIGQLVRQPPHPHDSAVPASDITHE